MDLTIEKQPKSDSFGIRSTNVMLDENYEPVEAIVLVKEGKIFDTFPVKHHDAEFIANLSQEWNIQDYGSLMIFPGIIDCNVHLHAGYDQEWDNVFNATRLAAAGGITTIVDNPILSKPFETGPEYIDILKEKIRILKQHSVVDFALFGLLEERTKDHLSEIIDTGVVGLKCYLLSCFQHIIKHIDPSELEQTLDMLNNKYPNLLVAFHPEVATEREIYLSSPCRFVEVEKRLDLNYEIKPLEYGGAANKGSFLDELQNKDDDDDDENDCMISDVNTPSKLKSQIKKSKERSEVNQLVHFELLSYGMTDERAKNKESSSDSDIESSTKPTNNTTKSEICLNLEKKKSFTIAHTEEENNSRRGLDNLPIQQDRIIEVDSDDNAATPKTSTIRADNCRKSLFAFKKTGAEEYDNQYDLNNNTELEKNEEPPIRKQERLTSLHEISKKNQSPEIILFPPEDPMKTQEIPIDSEKIEEVSKGNSHINLEDNLLQQKQPNKFKRFLDEGDGQNQEGKKNFPPASLVLGSKNKSSSEFRCILEDQGPHELKEDYLEAQSSNLDVPKFKKKLEILTQFEEKSPQLRKNSSNNSLSPGKKSVTPLNSSLLNRRISRKVSANAPVSSRSSISSPTSDLSKVSLLDISRSPNGYKKTEAIYNRNYKVFLANRPQNWEENGITQIISAFKTRYSLRIIVQNLSLASSFYKLRQLKKAHEPNNITFYGETGIPYLIFSEKMVKRGETKYKAAPPLREKENRRLLLENMKLCGIDVVSSYHFYVPPKYKTIDEGNFRRAFDGFNTIGFNLLALWTVLYNHFSKKSKKFNEDMFIQKKTIQDILHKIYEGLCVNPAKAVGIDDRKGSIKIGKDADFVIWDPYKTTTTADLPSDHLLFNKVMMGTIHKTFLRGRIVFDKDENLVVSKNSFHVEFIIRNA